MAWTNLRETVEMQGGYWICAICGHGEYKYKDTAQSHVLKEHPEQHLSRERKRQHDDLRLNVVHAALEAFRAESSERTMSALNEACRALDDFESVNSKVWW